MTILLLGATGRTGRHLLQESLDRGHIVHALVRDKSKVKIVNENLRLFEGSPLDKVAMNKAMTGCESILSALNISRYNDWPWSKLRTPKDFLSSVMKIIIELAPQHHYKTDCIYIRLGSGGNKKRYTRAGFAGSLRHSNILYPYEDHARQERVAPTDFLRVDRDPGSRD